VKLDKNDTLIIECNETKISNEQQYQIAKALRQLFPNNKILVFPKGYKTKIISET
jgi:hypothetical protein